MFLVSNPQLVLACCRSGIVGSFPALNQRESSLIVAPCTKYSFFNVRERYSDIAMCGCVYSSDKIHD